MLYSLHDLCTIIVHNVQMNIISDSHEEVYLLDSLGKKLKINIIYCWQFFVQEMICTYSKHKPLRRTSMVVTVLTTRTTNPYLLAEFQTISDIPYKDTLNKYKHCFSHLIFFKTYLCVARHLLAAKTIQPCSRRLRRFKPGRNSAENRNSKTAKICHSIFKSVAKPREFPNIKWITIWTC